MLNFNNIFHIKIFILNPKNHSILFLSLLLCAYVKGQTNTFPSSGNVGIGTTTPSDKLTVLGGVISWGDSFIGSYLEQNNTHRETILKGNMRLVFIADQSGPSSSDKQFIFGAGGPGTGATNFVEYMRIKEGKVGIGVSDPTYKLTVNGVISAKEVRVRTNPNSDYVFGPNYNLPPLSEVEAYIKANFHLPGIPSAEEFKQNGVGLGEMDDMLLRKVEELTLYLTLPDKKCIKANVGCLSCNTFFCCFPVTYRETRNLP